MKLKVTREDITNGESRSGMSCPIALALNRYFNCDGAVVTYSASYVPGKIWIDNSNQMKRFIDKFDNFQNVRPTTFNIKNFLTQERIK